MDKSAFKKLIIKRLKRSGAGAGVRKKIKKRMEGFTSLIL